MNEEIPHTTPIVHCKELSRLEKRAFDQGARPEEYVAEVGRQIALWLLSFLKKEKRPLYLLVGKGNNGADALAVGCELLKHHIPVTALHLCPPIEGSSLLQLQHKQFIAAAGTSLVFSSSFALKSEGILIDGLVGTGYRGSVDGSLYKLISWANQTGLPIFSIDIPSGLDGTTGEVNPIAISATTTFSLSLPKIGFFLRYGPTLTGKIVPISFGLPIETVEPVAHLMTPLSAASLLPPIKKTRHKYQRGYVLGGAIEMAGAALLSSLSAFRGGAGIVRLFYSYALKNELACSFPELIKEPWDLSNLERFLIEAKRAQALFLGPGFGRSPEAFIILNQLLPLLSIPTVLDADALYFLAQHPRISLPKQTLLTPHYKEMERLLDGEMPTFEACKLFASSRKIPLVLKGVPTFVFSPRIKPLIIDRGDPGMATAGAGDVLTGLIAALLAQGCSLEKGAALGVYLHSLAGELAALEKTSYAMIASDLIQAIPLAWKKLDYFRFPTSTSISSMPL